MTKAVVINLFGGPGLGKSTIAAGLFYSMKVAGFQVESVTEYAKDVVWDQAPNKFSDQLYITAKQNRRLWRLQDQVDWIVSDSPLLLGIEYAPPEYFPNFYRKLLFEVWDHYENRNFLLERTTPYDPVGRNQNETEAKEIDISIRKMLDKHKIKYTSLPSNDETVSKIFKELFPDKLCSRESNAKHVL